MKHQQIGARRRVVGQDADAVQRNRVVPPPLRRELLAVMSRVRPEDLSAAEITALLAIFRPAEARVVAGPAVRPALRLLSASGQTLRPP